MTRANRLLVIGTWIVATLTSGVVPLLFDFVFGLSPGIVAEAVAPAVVPSITVLLPRSLSPDRR